MERKLEVDDGGESADAPPKGDSGPLPRRLRAAGEAGGVRVCTGTGRRGCGWAPDGEDGWAAAAAAALPVDWVGGVAVVVVGAAARGVEALTPPRALDGEAGGTDRGVAASSGTTSMRLRLSERRAAASAARKSLMATRDGPSSCQVQIDGWRGRRRLMWSAQHRVTVPRQPDSTAQPLVNTMATTR